MVESTTSPSRRWECTHHPGHFVKPSRQKLGYYTGCSFCWRSSEAKARRAKKIVSEFISCARPDHSDRPCNLSYYIANGTRRCASCIHRRTDGSRKDSYQRSQHKADYNKAVRGRRSGPTSWSLTAVQLFYKNTGLTLGAQS